MKCMWPTVNSWIHRLAPLFKRLNSLDLDYLVLVESKIKKGQVTNNSSHKGVPSLPYMNYTFTLRPFQKGCKSERATYFTSRLVTSVQLYQYNIWVIIIFKIFIDFLFCCRNHQVTQPIPMESNRQNQNEPPILLPSIPIQMSDDGTTDKVQNVQLIPCLCPIATNYNSLQYYTHRHSHRDDSGVN